MSAEGKASSKIENQNHVWIAIIAMCAADCGSSSMYDPSTASQVSRRLLSAAAGAQTSPVCCCRCPEVS